MDCDDGLLPIGLRVDGELVFGGKGMDEEKRGEGLGEAFHERRGCCGGRAMMSAAKEEE